MLLWHELRPLQAMAAAFFFRHKRILLCLPRQYGGKTELGVRLAEDLLFRPTTKSCLFLAKDHPSAKKATREKFERLCPKDVYQVNTQQIYNKKNPQSTLFIASVDKDPDRLRGGTYAYVHWSEVAFSKLEKGETITGVFDKVVKPTLELTDGYVFLESTNNGKNGWFDIWENAKEYGLKTMRVNLSDMVYLGLITSDVYERIRTTTHPDVFRQEYECEWVTFQGKVYSEFSHAKHIDPDMLPPKPWQQSIMAIDWGYHPSATCVLFGYVQDDVLNVFDEHYAKEELATQTAEIIEQKKVLWGIENLAGVADHDPARIRELNDRNIQVTNADKVNILGSRVRIKERFYFDRLKIHPRCKNLIRDLDAAVWHTKKEGELDDSQCTWGHFDAEAALRYLERMLGESERKLPDKDPYDCYDAASAIAQMTREVLTNGH